MITITNGKSEDRGIRTFTISGHSGYGQEGQDIICAAVSALGQTAIAALEELTDVDIEYEIDDDKAYLHCKVILPDDVEDREYIKAQTIIDSFELGCRYTRDSTKKEYIRIKDTII